MSILYQNGAPATGTTLYAENGSKIRREAALRAVRSGDEVIIERFGLSLYVPPPPPEVEPEPIPEVTDVERIEQVVGLPIARIKEIILEAEENA